MHFVFYKKKNNILAFYIHNSYLCALFIKHQGVMFVSALMPDDN
jgi:hypothetical protein